MVAQGVHKSRGGEIEGRFIPQSVQKRCSLEENFDPHPQTSDTGINDSVVIDEDEEDMRVSSPQAVQPTSADVTPSSQLKQRGLLTASPPPPAPISATAVDLGVNGDIDEDVGSRETNKRSDRSTVKAFTDGETAPRTDKPAVTSHTTGDRLHLAGASSMRGVPRTMGSIASAPRTQPRIALLHILEVEQSLRINVISN
jgi:hypothetical protein